MLGSYLHALDLLSIVSLLSPLLHFDGAMMLHEGSHRLLLLGFYLMAMAGFGYL